MSLSPREYIRHIHDEIDYIQSQLPGEDFESFSQDETLKRAFGVLGSILFGRLVFGEGFTRRQGIAAALMVLGTSLLALA